MGSRALRSELDLKPKVEIKVPHGVVKEHEGEPVAEIEVKPYEQPRMSLGIFTHDKPPKGFSIEISPDPDPPESVVTQITQSRSTKGYELILHIANYSNKTLSAEVRRI